MEKFQNFCLKSIAVIGAVIFTILSYYSLRYTVRRYYSGDLIDSKDNIISHLLLFVLLILFVIIIRKISIRFKIKQEAVHVFAIVCSVTAAALCLNLVQNTDFQPITDALQLVYNAVCIAQGDYSAVADMGYAYFRLYPYQLGLVEIYALLFKIAGNYVYNTILVTQSVLTGVAVYGGFRIVREITDSIQGQIIYMFFALNCVPVYFYAMFFYGETWGICFAILGSWMFIAANKANGKKSAIYFALSTAFMMVACVTRGALIIVWIAMFCIQLLILLKNKKFMPVVAMLIMLAVIMAAEHAVIALAERQTGFDFGEGCPKIMWIAMGLDKNEGSIFGPGSYNGFNADNYIASGYDAEFCRQLAYDHIAEVVQSWGGDPAGMFSFFKTKTMAQWNEPTYGAFYHTYYMENQQEWLDRIYFDEDINGIIRQYMNQYQFILYFAVFGYFINLFIKKHDVLKYLPGLIIIGEFFFSLMWESGSRYVYPYIVLVIPAAVVGLMFYADIFEGLFRKMYIKKRG